MILALATVAGRETLWRDLRPAFWAALAGLFFAADLACWHRSIRYIGPGLAREPALATLPGAEG